MKRAAAPLLAIALTVPVPSLAGPGGPDAHAPPIDDGAGAVEPTTAEDWLRLGLARYEAGEFKAAVEAFRRGHALDPRPQFLFAIAQAERRRGDCAAAIRAYDQFLATSPPEEQAIAAQEQRDKCVQALRPPEPEPEIVEPDPEPEPEAPVPIVVAPPPGDPPWWRDPVTLGVGGGAVALGLTGVAFLVAADAAAGDAATANRYDDYVALKDRAESRHTAGIVTLAAGVALGGVAAYRVLGDRPARGERPAPAARVEVGPGPGLGLAVGGRF